ncbi:MAG: MltA domain-containing protein [Myxococcales bacterium]|nr:MltA domain-containing protein [Myxococcales bacterium]
MRSLLAFVALALASACTPRAVVRPSLVIARRPPVRPVARPVVQPAVVAAPVVATAPAAPVSPFAALPGWSEDTIAEALPAFRRTCERIARASDTRSVGRENAGGTIADWRPACAALPAADADHTTVRAFFERWFTPVAVTGDNGTEGFFTGYYEPLLRGSRRRHGRFRTPLYTRPRDMVSTPRGTGRLVRGRFRRYHTRAEIAAGALRRTAQVIVWVDDPVDAFFLEIQGSGRVELDDGTTLQINYAASNGHEYVAIGRTLIDRGAIERSQVSLQTIRAWLSAHPREAQSVMNTNPSYVFFRESETQGAHGAEGVVLEPGRSMAVDPRFVPLGVPLYLDVAPLEGVGPIRRLVVAQDTGGAIRGAVRGDLFWGHGQDAYDRAGRMRQRGRYWMLLPKPVAARRAEGATASTSAQGAASGG